jgi:PKD repeat protein
MFPGANGLPDPNTRATFVAAASGPVDLKTGPGGKLYYVDYDGGRIIRIDYNGPNQPPVAVASASPTSGTAPLAVSFDGSASSDPEGGPLTYAWDLDGDGAFTDSAVARPTRTYSVGTYTIRLRVTDSQGAATTSAPLTINASNTAPTPTITDPAATTMWKVGDRIDFAGGASDQQEGTVAASGLMWELAIEHCPSNCHEHVIQTWTGVAGGFFTAPDHEYPSYLRLRLTATDSNGAKTTTWVDLQPRVVNLSFQTSPPGLQLTVGSASQPAPFTRTVIEGSANSVSANSPQTLNGTLYSFSSWSDSEAQTHTIVASADASYVATYGPALTADIGISKSVSSDGRTWTLQVANAGPDTAANVVVTDTLPSRLSLQTTPAACVFNTKSRLLTCPLGDLSPGSTRTITLSTAVAKGNGPITNTAQVKSATADPNTANNSSTARYGK